MFLGEATHAERLARISAERKLREEEGEIGGEDGGGGWAWWIWDRHHSDGGGDGVRLETIHERKGEEEEEEMDHETGERVTPGGGSGSGGGGAHVRVQAACTSFTHPSVMSRVYLVMDEYRLTLQLLFFFLGLVILWQCADHCMPCIFVLMIVSCFFCLEYRLVNLLLWACIVVLWMHGWSFSSSNNGLHASMGWNRRR